MAELPIHPEMSVAAPAEAKTIVVADATAFVRDRFMAALKAAGHKASATATSAELVAHLQLAGARIDLVVLDLRLPAGRRARPIGGGHDLVHPTEGVDLVRSLRKINGLKASLVVFSGTVTSAREVRELAWLGVTAYVNEYTAEQHIVPSLTPHLYPDGANRRRSLRANVSMSVSYRFGNTIATAVTLNVSRGGVSLRTTSPLEIGTDLKVRFQLPETRTEIKCEAKVAWVDRRVGMGLQFTQIGADDQDVIDEFVYAKCFSSRKS